MARVITCVAAVLPLIAWLGPVAAAGQETRQASSWSAVQRLEPGSEIVVRTRDGVSHFGKAALADEAGFIVIKRVDPPLPGHVERALVGLGPRLSVAVQGAPMNAETVRLSREGIFDGEQKLAALEDVVRRFDRATVAEVRARGAGGSRTRRGALWGGLIGFAGGALAGSVYNDGDPSLDRGAAVGILGGFGAGVGALVGGLIGERTRSDLVVYAAPK